MSEFPPVIIDSLGVCDDRLLDRQEFRSVLIRSVDFAGNSSETVTSRATVTSLYLVRDNRIIHQGDFEPNEVELIYASGAGTERSMAAGRSDVVPGADAGLDAGANAAAAAVPKNAKHVRMIRTRGETELHAGTDFHDFLLILRRSAD